MSNPLFQPPFKVRLADPGMSFYDSLSKLDISGSKIDTVVVLTPLTDQWLRGGGLVRILEEETSLNSEPTDEEDEEKEESTETNLESSTQEPAQTPSGDSEGADEEKAPTSLDDLLKNAGGTDEEDESAPAATKTEKKVIKTEKK